MSNVREMDITRYRQGFLEHMRDLIIEESPLNIFLNNQYYATLMCIPQELKELSIGFLFSEGIIESINEVTAVEFGSDDIIFINLTKEVEVKDSTRKALVSGCGRGMVDINVIYENKIGTIKGNNTFNGGHILSCMKDFNTMSELFNKTGGVHSSCICDDNGIVMMCEDIGRHNAIDKIIGKCMLEGVDIKSKVMFTTGRISSDSIIKAAKAGIPILVSHSGPTSLAVDMAKKIGMTVVGFARGSRMNIYSGIERVSYSHI